MTRKQAEFRRDEVVRQLNAMEISPEGIIFGREPEGYAKLTDELDNLNAILFPRFGTDSAS
jgi:hypothetical protein